MKQILWFRRDLRLNDNAILAHAKGEVLPIFIFDTNILSHLPHDDKRLTFIYNSVSNLKKELQNIGLDLAIFFDTPINVFKKLHNDFDMVLCSCDFDQYAIQRDKEIEDLIPMQRYYDSFLIHPNTHLKKDGTPYKVFTPFYNSLEFLWGSKSFVLDSISTTITLSNYQYDFIPTIEQLGFKEQVLEELFYKSARVILEEFIPKLSTYQNKRDYFYLNATSNIATYLRFGLISPREIFNIVASNPKSDFYIRELFWREFYNYILYHFPYSQFENFNKKVIKWEENNTHFTAWCEGNTGVPIIDAAMRHLNATGMMHNRLRMIVASFLTKNLLLDWRLGEHYFALKLMDYETSSNIGSWQWGASTGADAAPYFRIFNPYSQSEKFDKDALFIKTILPELKDVEPKQIHKEGALMENIFIQYPSPIVDCKITRIRAIERFKYASDS